MKNIQDYITEIDKKVDIYNDSELTEAKECYDQYINLIIKSSPFNKYIKDNLKKYWEKLK